VIKDKNALLSITKNIYQIEGLKGFYKGWFMTLQSASFYLALNLGSYDWISEEYRKLKHKSSDLANLFIGGIAGLFSSTFSYPSDIIRRRLQITGVDNSIQKYKGIIDCVVKMYKNEGFQSYFKGMGANYAKVIPSTALMFFSYEKMNYILKVNK